MTDQFTAYQGPHAESRYGTYWHNAAESLHAVRVISEQGFVFENANPAHERLTGIAAHLLIGKTPHEALPADAADALCAQYIACLHAGQPITYECTIDLGGGMRMLSGTLAPVRAAPGDDVFLILGGLRERREDARRIARTLSASAKASEQVRSILAGIREGYFTLDRDLIVTDVNEPVLRWLGASREAVIGRPYLELFPKSFLKDSAVRARLDESGVNHTEFESRINPGRWIEARLHKSSFGYTLLLREITARRLSAQTIERTNTLLDATLNAISAQVAILDEVGRIVLTNTSWRDLVQSGPAHKHHQWTGTPYLDCGILEVCDRWHGLALRSTLRSLLRGDADEFRQTVRMARDDGERWYQIRAARFSIEGTARIVVTHEDISSVHQAQQTVKELSQRLVSLQEDERQRIALELHDSTTQHLTSIGLHLMLLRQRSTDGDPMQYSLDQISASLEEAQRELRTFSYLLHPPYLDKDGLKMTLARLAAGFSSRAGLALNSEIDDGIDNFSSDAQRAVLRVVQEALSNVHKHARATTVSVRIKVRLATLMVMISDDGKGIERPSAAGPARSPASGLGLPGMQTRVSQLDGMTKILSGPRGTTIIVKIPLSSCYG